MIRVLVTGAAGQLGRSIQERSKDYPNLELTFYSRQNLDITIPKQVENAFAEVKPMVCINCAAYTAVDNAEKDPETAFLVNSGGVRNLTEACLTWKVRLIHISTDYVFDGKKTGGYVPTDSTNPINVYGSSKLHGEKIIQKRLTNYNIIRTSWLYSRKHGPNFYLNILERARSGRTLKVITTQKGCPTDANHLAEHILRGIEENKNVCGITHFTDGEVMSWYDFACKILKEHDLLQKVNLVPVSKYATFAKRPEYSILLN